MTKAVSNVWIYFSGRYQLSKCFSEDGFWGILEHPCMLGCLPIDLLPMGLLGMPPAAGEAGRVELEDISPRNWSHSSPAAHKEATRTM